MFSHLPRVRQVTFSKAQACARWSLDYGGSQAIWGLKWARAHESWNIIFLIEGTYNKLNISMARLAKGKFKESEPGKGERDRVSVAKGKFKESAPGKKERNRIRVAKRKFKESALGKGERNRIMPFWHRKI